MNVYVSAFGGLALGLVLRTFLPYLIACFTSLQEGGGWLTFELKYLGSLGLAAIVYAVTLLTVPGTLDALLAMEFVAIVAMAYAGEDLARQAIKLLVPRAR